TARQCAPWCACVVQDERSDDAAKAFYGGGAFRDWSKSRPRIAEYARPEATPRRGRSRRTRRRARPAPLAKISPRFRSEQDRPRGEIVASGENGRAHV